MTNNNTSLIAGRMEFYGITSKAFFEHFRDLFNEDHGIKPIPTQSAAFNVIGNQLIIPGITFIDAGAIRIQDVISDFMSRSDIAFTSQLYYFSDSQEGEIGHIRDDGTLNIIGTTSDVVSEFGQTLPPETAGYRWSQMISDGSYCYLHDEGLAGFIINSFKDSVFIDFLTQKSEESTLSLPLVKKDVINEGSIQCSSGHPFITFQ